MTVADQGARDQALDIRRSFAVSAPAGSGKTGLLIRRTLRLLADCEHPEQVLAITFTRKAAAEMHERILDALRRGQDDTPPRDDYLHAIWQDARSVLARDADKDWQLLANPGRLRIMTIDSLCRHLARQLAVETGLGDLPEPSELPEFDYRAAIRALFARLDEGSDPVSEPLALLLGHLDNHLAALEGLLENLLARREQWLQPLLNSRDARHALEQALADTVAECLTDLARVLGPVASELAMLCDYAATNLTHLEIDHPLARCLGMEALPDTDPCAANLSLWLAVAELLLTKSGSWRAKVDKRSGFPTDKEARVPERATSAKQQLKEVIDWCREQPGLLDLLTDLRQLPPPAYTDSQWQLLDALTRVLPSLVAELTLVFQERRACDFTEITLAALRALGDEDDPSDLSLRLDYQIRHILVDEFQDTSSLQFGLLRRLVAGWQPGDGRTLFIVGDGMQSLYGFRNANVGLFLEARQAPVNQVPLTPLDLTVNFRSDRSLVDWVNHHFRAVFPARADISRGAVPYAEAQAANSGDGDAKVTLDLFDPPSDPRDEAAVVVSRVRDALALDPAGSIAILTRARGHLTEILSALYQAGIPWQATDIDPLASRMPVVDLLSLTRALLNPADRVAWLALLRAPWCGLGLSDLHRVANPEHAEISRDANFPWLPGRILDPATPGELSDAGRAALERTGTVLRAAWANRQRKPLRLWIEGLWLALGGPATLLDSVELAWCQQYFDLLEDHARGAGLEDMEAFEQAASRLYAAPATGHGNPVQIMTIHKSKGLEFDTVIIPALHRGGGKGERTLLHWRERISASGESQLLIAPPLSIAEQEDNGATRHDDIAASRLVAHLKHEQKLKNALEDARVLYVACTRAVRRLHLLTALPANNPASGSLLASLWPALENGFDGCGAEVAHHGAKLTSEATDEEAGDAPATLETLTELLRLPPHWRNPAGEFAAAQWAPSAEATALARHPDDGDPLPRHTGTVLHRTLSRIVADGVELWNEERVPRQRQAWRVQLTALGVEDCESALDILQEAVTRALNHDQGRWLLDNRHPGSACELALGHPGDNGLASHSVMDRAFVHDGVLWIIDYKSSRPLENQSTEDFVTTETQRYRDQLARYRRAMAPRHGGDIRTALYFPLLPLLVEVETGDG